ncbi:MAG: ATPase, partial [Deltaproteobacteria bacterium]
MKGGMDLFAGIDVGSSAAKAVVVDGDCNVLAIGTRPSGAYLAEAATGALEEACNQAGCRREQIGVICSTGFGRDNVEFAALKRTEIDCHGRGAFHLYGEALTVVDIGGQDNKIIRLDDSGRRLDFTMNRKCAAGTGAFLEEFALRLKVPLEKLSELAALSSDHDVQIGSFCTVFAMTEVLSRIRAGTRVEDLARAALESVARRVLEARRLTGRVVATGGVVAHQPIMKDIL